MGAGGWLGLASLELLHRLLGAEAFARRVVAIGSSARLLELRGRVRVDQRPLAALATLEPAPSLVLHLAYLTQEKARSMSEADYVGANRAISTQVLSSLDTIGATRVFVPSSGAAYRVDDEPAPASVRLYGRLKLEDEAAFGAWARRRGATAVIARVFNLAGPYINKHSSYALASFIADALAGRPIEIRASAPVWRSYVAISELMSVVFGALMAEGPGPAVFDTAGEAVVEMGDLANAVAAALGSAAGVSRPPMAGKGADRYVGDGATWRELRRLYGVAAVDLASQIVETAGYMKGLG